MKEFSRKPREVTHVLLGRWVRTDGAMGGVGRTRKCCCGVGGVRGHTGLFTEAPNHRTGSFFPRFDITRVCRVCSGNIQPHARPHRPSAWLAVGRLSYDCVLTGLFHNLLYPFWSLWDSMATGSGLGWMSPVTAAAGPTAGSLSPWQGEASAWGDPTRCGQQVGLQAALSHVHSLPVLSALSL